MSEKIDMLISAFVLNQMGAGPPPKVDRDALTSAERTEYIDRLKQLAGDPPLSQGHRADRDHLLKRKAIIIDICKERGCFGRSIPPEVRAEIDQALAAFDASSDYVPWRERLVEKQLQRHGRAPAGRP